MSHTEKKGLSPKYVIHKSGYHAVKSPLSQKKKKPSYPDQFIILNSDINYFKFIIINKIINLLSGMSEVLSFSNLA